MNNGSLRPPNYESLSGDVITEVVQHSRSSSKTHVDSEARLEHYPNYDPSAHQFLHPYSEVRAHFSSKNWYDRVVSSRENLPKETQGIPSKHKVTKLTSKNKSVSREDVVLLRRQRRSLAQHRYRTRIRVKEKMLDHKVSVLREHVERLKRQHKQIISRGVPTETRTWGIVAEYYRMFGNGLAPPATQNFNNSANNTLRPVGMHRHFLQAVMAPDVSVDTGYGIDTLLWSWEMLSRCYKDFDLKLMRLENGAGNSLVSATKVTISFNESILRSLFPHLASDSDEETTTSALASKLLGREIEMHGTGHFVWNDNKNQIVSATYSTDMLTPMLKLLGSLEDVERIFDKAVVTPECRLVFQR